MRWILVAGLALVVAGCQETVRFTIDAGRELHRISPYIYGVNEAIAPPFEHATMRRVGGNRWTAYNWTNNASNAGNDWYFENDGYLFRGNAPGGPVGQALDDAAAHGAAALITIPINGFVAADKNGDKDLRKADYSHLQTRFRLESPRKPGAFTLRPDPGSAVVYQDEFVNWIKATHPDVVSDPGRPVWFAMDNEPDLWFTTHNEVHPYAATYEEVVGKTIEHAAAIKDVMPGALIFGPVNYGWQGFVRLQGAPDADGRDFQEFYLDEMRDAEMLMHRRLLDVLDVHWYPEATGGGHRIIEPVNTAAVAAARIQAPRSLFDPAYREESWIAEKALKGPIVLLPRLRRKIEGHYPGTKLAVTEYNYGGGHDISGAIAEADVLGILGVEDVFAACEWPLEKEEPFIGAGFAMYRNFDGEGGRFGDVCLEARSGDLARASVYASGDGADRGKLVVVAINKTARPLPARIELMHNGVGYSAMKVFVLTAEQPVPKAAAAIPVKDMGHFTYLMPALSVSTLVLVPE